jgi:integrase
VENEDTMRRKPYPEREDGMRVWLAPGEVDELLDVVGTSNQRQVAVSLAARCGLRRQEIVGVTPADLVEGSTGEDALRVRKPVAKFGHYREVPVPEPLAARIDALDDLRDQDDPVVDVTGKTVYRWVTSAGEYLAREHADEGWLDLDVHDLRRTWGTHLLEQGVLPSVVMDWGGWRSWETFRKHYLGEFSPGALQRERGKVSFLEGDVAQDDNRVDGRPPAVGLATPTREHLNEG